MVRYGERKLKKKVRSKWKEMKRPLPISAVGFPEAGQYENTSWAAAVQVPHGFWLEPRCVHPLPILKLSACRVTVKSVSRRCIIRSPRRPVIAEF